MVEIDRLGESVSDGKWLLIKKRRVSVAVDRMLNGCWNRGTKTTQPCLKRGFPCFRSDDPIATTWITSAWKSNYPAAWTKGGPRPHHLQGQSGSNAPPLSAAGRFNTQRATLEAERRSHGFHIIIHGVCHADTCFYRPLSPSDSRRPVQERVLITSCQRGEENCSQHNKTDIWSWTKEDFRVRIDY